MLGFFPWMQQHGASNVGASKIQQTMGVQGVQRSGSISMDRISRFNEDIWGSLKGQDAVRAVINSHHLHKSVNAGDSGSELTIDWGAGNVQLVTLTANATLFFTPPYARESEGLRATPPQDLVLIVKQDTTGSRTVTWDGDVVWSGGTAPTLSTTASVHDIILFRYFEGLYYAVSVLAGSGDHGGLSGLLDDDHTQYLLIDGTRAMTGDLDMGSQDIHTVTQVRIGTSPSTLDELDVDGSILNNHTSTEDDDHALEIDCNAAGYADVKAIDIDYITGALAANEEEGVILINIDEVSATGGIIFGVEVLATEGSADAVYGMLAGAGVGPIEQLSGVLADADTVDDNGSDVTVALSGGGAGNVSVFENDNEYMIVGDAAQFGEIEFVVDTAASGAGIQPLWEYSTGVGTWAAFVPTDGTNGMRNTGVVAWVPSDLSSWAVGTGSEYLVRVTRQRNSLTTTPILDKVQIAAITEYGWDKNGIIDASRLKMDHTFMASGRLTLATGDAVPSSDQTAKTTVYFTPYNGNMLPLYNGTRWDHHAFSELSVSVPSTTDTNFDVFVYDNSGTLTLETVDWTNDTTRATAITLQNGLYVKSGATGRLYLGTCRTTGVSGQTEDSTSKRFLWNYFNRVSRGFQVTESTNSWTYSSTTWRPLNNSTTNRMEIVVGVREGCFTVLCQASVLGTASASAMSVGLGIDQTAGNDAPIFGAWSHGSSQIVQCTTLYHGGVAAGYHYLQVVESGPSSGTGTFYGDAGVPTRNQAGAIGWMDM